MNIEKLRETLKKEWHLPFSEKVMNVIRAFSLTEKTIFSIFFLLLTVSGLSLLWQVNKLFLVEVPDYGGTLTEGILGFPRFINPLLASSDIDKDLVTLVYSGLLKVDSKGELVTDLAESFNISPDSLTYTFVLKDNLYFHDGTRVTTDDIVFTIEKAQDPNLKSPRYVNWEGVVVNKIDEKTISFTLKQPYSPFIQNLTLGILPKHIWKTASQEEFPFSQYNTKPIGTGPYKIYSITYTGSGIPSEYHLESYRDYALGRPYISKLILKSYGNEKDILESYRKGNIESFHSLSPKDLPTLSIPKEEIILSPLTRVFGLFFNQNMAPVFVNKEVRQALNMALDKNAIVESVLQGYGQAIDGPLPSTIIVNKAEVIEVVSSTTQSRVDQAKALLVKNGWQQNDTGIFQKKDKTKTITLAFSISTGDAPELKEAAYLLQKQWKEIGAQVEVKIFEIGDLNQNIIRPRKYDSLLFGEVVGRELDFYPFWHSSERITPGLNIALYTNIKVDKILENIRRTTDISLQKTYFDNFEKEIKNDVPAVFTYSPYFIYIVPKKVQSVSLKTLTVSSERFSNIFEWYIETNNVWKIFTKK